MAEECAETGSRMRRQQPDSSFRFYWVVWGHGCGAVLNMQPYALILNRTALRLNPEIRAIPVLAFVNGAGQAWHQHHIAEPALGIAGITVGFLQGEGCDLRI